MSIASAPRSVSDSISASRLILGGHSFNGPLGNEPVPSCSECRDIVAACLAQGISTFDTTYALERVALREALTGLDGAIKQQARPIIWNFFGHSLDPLPGPLAWTEARLAEALSELSPSGSIKPLLVLHTVSDAAANAAQCAAVKRWKREGRVGGVGLWPASSLQDVDPTGGLIDFVVAPWNPISAAKTRPAFVAARERGILTVATSPFVRGWELDRLTLQLVDSEGLSLDKSRLQVADALLRYAAFAPEVDHLIVAMRAAKYVPRNLESLKAGPLTPGEHAWLEQLAKSPGN